MKTNGLRKWLVLVLLMKAVVLASATGAQSQSAADVQNAIGIPTNPSTSPQERTNAARNLAVFRQYSDSAAQAVYNRFSSATTN